MFNLIKYVTNFYFSQSEMQKEASILIDPYL